MASYLSGFEHLEIQLEEIRIATNNFDESKVIGVGGFGKVYEGELSYPEGKRMVAFKRLDRKHGQGDPEFFKEIRMLSSYKHDNLISLLGFCKEGDEMILIYEHASRGSLDRILNDSNLTWTCRLKICIDAAKGLDFLHDPSGSQQRVLHRDIKSANILLDENLNAKVSDFGLSRISPANQKYTILVTSPVGTPGYCDPLYMDTYQLTKESDVYSFGVVLFEVLCGRVCYENSNGKLKVFVHFWKKCYEDNKLDDIIFPDIKHHHQLEPGSVQTFVEIAYQCLQRTREQRPTMSIVVENLEAALELKERHDLKLKTEHEQEVMRKAEEYEAEQMRKAAEYEYREILKLADPPLIYKSVMELKALLFKGLPVNGGKTLLSINDKMEVYCERVYIEACLDQIQLDRLRHPLYFKSEATRFPGGLRYFKYEDELKLCVRAQFLCPLITYSVNLVFTTMSHCKTLLYTLNGEEKCCVVYSTYKREDGWYVVPLYQFTSVHKTADLEIEFGRFRKGCMLEVAGFEFQLLEEKVELYDEGLEEYQDIVKAASQPLFYKSIEELKELLSIGFNINNYRTWFSLNENGERCEMVSIAHCFISGEGGNGFYAYNPYSRFPTDNYRTNQKGFKVHIRTQFLSPSITYTVNLVFGKDYSLNKYYYVGLKYKLEGEKENSIVYLATTTKDDRSFIAELYQFTSTGRTFDIEIVFEDHKDDLEVEGILFQPLETVELVCEYFIFWKINSLEKENFSYIAELYQFISNGSDFDFEVLFKDHRLCLEVEGNLAPAPRKRKQTLLVEHEQVLESEELSNTCLEWTMCSNLFKWIIGNGQEGYAFDKNGNRALMLSARGVIGSDKLSFKRSRESRFGEVAVITNYRFDIKKEIHHEELSRKTTYACYLVYKLTRDQLVLDPHYGEGHNYINRYIYLVSPPETPIIGQKLDKKTHSPLKRSDVIDVSRQRSDGWMEIKLWTPSSTATVKINIYISLWTPVDNSGLIVESIELRPTVAHSV